MISQESYRSIQSFNHLISPVTWLMQWMKKLTSNNTTKSVYKS